MKNKIIYIALFLIVVLLIGGLVYNEYYIEKERNDSQVSIYYAKNDISENESISKSDLMIKRINPKLIEGLDVIYVPNHTAYDMFKSKLENGTGLTEKEAQIYKNIAQMIKNENRLFNGKAKVEMVAGDIVRLSKLSKTSHEITQEDIDKYNSNHKAILEKLSENSGLTTEEILLLNEFLIVKESVSGATRVSLEDSQAYIKFKVGQRIVLDDRFNDKFEVKIQPKWKSDIKKSDKVRVYVQLLNKKTQETKIFEIFKEKSIKDISYVIRNGQPTTQIQSVVIDASDKGALDYYNAKSLAQATGNTSGIIMLKYNQVLQKDFLNVSPFKIDSEEVRSIIKANAEVESGSNYIDNNNQVDDNSNPFLNSSSSEDDNSSDNNSTGVENEDEIQTITASYTVKDGDTLESIAVQFSTTEEKIKEENPEVDFENLELGTELTIVTEL